MAGIGVMPAQVVPEPYDPPADRTVTASITGCSAQPHDAGHRVFHKHRLGMEHFSEACHARGTCLLVA